ncbi:MAG: preprotein translocase subunit SecE [Alphaproteobacteria bacterium]
MLAKANKKTSFFQFFRQTRQEILKVTWPTSKEVIVTSVLVFFMVLAFAIFFLIVDQILGFCVRFVLGWGH